MDLQQPLLNNNSSCRSTTNTGGVLLPPINTNLTIMTATATANSTTTAGTVENIAKAITSPSTSPTTAIVNNHHHHHHNHRSSQSLVTQKSNQVSTVLLYNIPIVSLYIEGQERLCLAQISNTLLKQFSYNEIHNRRVALGITCVQCTPVQLEILRRAGAMPVSSRRCGMITRREAERLCKSFLGDNTPPRLPEDFAFNVQHKCSWGCRGAFLPSRYNSSRAKCIKCHYCGLFFSPNKFIFHSHRIGPGDKYVQPDAANFNSWRRHMMLSGQPPQEVMYAWEDVKAMFNGGTRKRLLNSNSSSPLSRVPPSSPNSCSAGASSSSMTREQSTEDVLNANADALLNNTQKSSNSVNTVTTAAAVVGVAAVAVGSTVRPLNLHFQASTAAGVATQSSYSVGTDMHLIPAAALSRSFMMDYMWQHAHQAAKNTYNHHYQQQQQEPKTKSLNSAFSFPWLNATASTTSDIQNNDNLHSNVHYTPSVNNNNNRWSNSTTNTTDITRNLTQIMNTSAFKPVVQQQHHQQPPAETHTPSSSLIKSRRRHSTPQPSTNANESKAPSSLLFSTPNKTYFSLFSSDEEDHDNKEEEEENADENIHHVEEDSEVVDDDILVDIETTEDEKPIACSNNNNITIVSNCSRLSFTNDNTESQDDIENTPLDIEKPATSDEDVIDVVHNDNDDTVLEFTSLTPSAIITKHTKEHEQMSSSSPSSATFRDSKELDKLYRVDYNNAENVPPPPQPALSISPKSNSSSSCSQSSECFYINGKSRYEAITANSVLKSTSRSPDLFDEHKINAAILEKSTKNTRKRACEKLLNDENEKITWRQQQPHDISAGVAKDNYDKDERSVVANTVDSSTKYRRKSLEPNSKEAQFIEALTQKYELTYYNNNNGNSKNNYTNNNNNNNNNNQIISNNNGNEFWQMARLCMQRPINTEQNNKVQQQHNHHQQLARLPTFYYRQQQLLLSPAAAEHNQQQQHQNSSTQAFPATQQVYLHLQQHHQHAVQKSQNHYSNEISQSSNSSSLTPVSTLVYPPESGDFASAYINMRQNNPDPANKPNRSNGVG